MLSTSLDLTLKPPVAMAHIWVSNGKLAKSIFEQGWSRITDARIKITSLFLGLNIKWDFSSPWTWVAEKKLDFGFHSSIPWTGTIFWKTTRIHYLRNTLRFVVYRTLTGCLGSLSGTSILSSIHFNAIFIDILIHIRKYKNKPSSEGVFS